MTHGQVGNATKIILAVNAALALLFFFDDLWAEVITAAGLFPGRFTIGDGGYQGFLLPVWLTPFSAAFLHGGWAHVIVNMLMLLLMGRLVEPVYGSSIFTGLYVAGIVVSAAVEILASYLGWYGAGELFVPAVGASGALSAVIGAYMILFPNKPPRALGPIPAKPARFITLMAGWIALNMMFAFVAPQYGVQIAIWSHIGGFAAGLALATPLLRFRYRHA